jgi:elongation factor G
LRVEPKNRGEGYEWENEVKGGNIPREFIPAIEKGVKEALENGVVAGFPLVDLKVVVTDGSYHEVDSSEMSFKIAGSMAVQAAVKAGDPIILEPIMQVEVTTPSEFMGDVIGDLSSKRAQIQGTDQRGTAVIIRALVPLSEMQGYVTILRSMTQGRASSVMIPSHYEEVPQSIAAAIIEKNKPQGSRS